MHYEYTTKGTCSRTIFFDIQRDVAAGGRIEKFNKRYGKK